MRWKEFSKDCPWRGFLYCKAIRSNFGICEEKNCAPYFVAIQWERFKHLAAELGDYKKGE